MVLVVVPFGPCYVVPRGGERRRMVRKPTDTAHLNLRYPEALRRRLERAAKNGGRSMNSEIIERLEQSFRREDFEKFQDAKNLFLLKIVDAFADLVNQMPPSRGPGLLDMRDLSPEQLRQLLERLASTD
jgi:hypothetical protein